LIPLAVEIPPEAPREAIDKPAIAREAIKRLGLDGSMEPAELLENLTVEPEEGTNFFRLSYRDGDPQKAQRIANAVVEVASEESHQVSDQVDLRIHVWDDASVPTDPLSANPVRNAALALTLGLAVGIGLVLLMDKRSQT
jgi:capsular polysaccharide biosynthesis protein